MKQISLYLCEKLHMDTTYIINHRDIVSRVEIPATDSVNVCELSDVVTE